MAITVSMTGRRALVTGGSGGIGSAVVRTLLEAGARVASIDLPGAPPPPEGAIAVPADLSDSASAAGAVAAAAAALDGGLDTLVQCAGITRDALHWKMPEEDWRAVLDVNLTAAFLVLRASTPFLRAAGTGAVVLLSSINGQRGKFGQANYAASKAGLEALAKSAARELGRFDVRVNAVAPGFIPTTMTERVPEELRRAAVGESVFRRAGRPEDVANAVLYLVSDLSTHVTGQVLRVDGGQLIA